MMDLLCNAPFQLIGAVVLRIWRVSWPRGFNRTGELMEQAQDKEKEGDVARERMQRNYSLLPKAMETPLASQSPTPTTWTCPGPAWR